MFMCELKSKFKFKYYKMRSVSLSKNIFLRLTHIYTTESLKFNFLINQVLMVRLVYNKTLFSFHKLHLLQRDRSNATPSFILLPTAAYIIQLHSNIQKLCISNPNKNIAQPAVLYDDVLNTVRLYAYKKVSCDIINPIYIITLLRYLYICLGLDNIYWSCVSPFWSYIVNPFSQCAPFTIIII